MHPFSVVTLAIFIAGYITARWDLVTRLYELAIFAADHGVVVSTYCIGLKFFCTALLTQYHRLYRLERRKDLLSSLSSFFSSLYLSTE